MNNIKHLTSEMQLASLSGYPICKIITNNLLTQEELIFLKTLKKKLNNFKDKNINLNLSEETDILRYKQLEKIKKIIWSNFDDYINKVLQIKNQFYICNSWCTIQKKGDYHPQHIHPNHIFSAVYYAQANKSGLKFTLEKSKIQEGFLFDYEIKNYNVFNSSTWLLEVNSGDIVIFPGQLKHESTICQSDDERIIIGSSYFIKGDIGTNSKYNNININSSKI
jgi:uncharacterized protein (TIGR02466 family)